MRITGSRLLAACILFSVGCGGGDGAQTSLQYDFDLNPVDGGDAVLERSAEGLTVSGTAAGLRAGEAFTVWWVIFNTPAGCFFREDPNLLGASCGDPDFFDAQIALAGTAFGYCDGFLIDDGGAFSCTRSTEDGAFVDGLGGLTAPEEAEVHLLLRSHGPTLAGELQTDQLTSLNGGCESGEPNAGRCINNHIYTFVDN